MTIGAAFLLLLFAAGAAQVSSKKLFASPHLKSSNISDQVIFVQKN